jgi:hypothetical protein
VSLSELEQNATERKCGPVRTLAMVFGSTLFLSAFLLFQVQLIIGKYILPWFGGSAAVWTTSMLVFQILLLGGYVYSHLVSERLSQRAQSNLHLGLLSAAFLVVLTLSLLWPSAITPSPAWKPLNSVNPLWSVTVILFFSIGLPFFVLSTTGPLLQRWFAYQGGSTQTYRFYAISNLGSLLGLLTFPFLLEPSLHMTTQGRLWTFLFSLFAVGCGWCAWRARHGADDETSLPSENAPLPSHTTPIARALWVLLPGCASALLLATTNLLCQEITSIPLLWVLPLALYLLSFILCFDHPRWYRRQIFHPLLLLGIPALYLAMHFSLATPQLVIVPLLLFVACMTCHGELVKLKPEVQRLTSFYLAISAGGALGGIFVAVVAPLLFRFFTEYEVALAACVILLLCCLFLDADSWIYRMSFWLTAGIALAIITAPYAAGKSIPALPQMLDTIKFYPLAILIGGLVLPAAFLQKSRGKHGKRAFCAGQVLVVFVAALSLAVLYEIAQPARNVYLGKRNFYGALRVYRLQAGGKLLEHGRTRHGLQLDPPYNRIPLAYYGTNSGIGILLKNHPKRTLGNPGLRVGVVGMGAGTLAAYGLPGDYFRFYEIDPDVIDLSGGAQPVFTYVRDSQAKVDIELGDARLLLENEMAHGEEQNFDVLVLDAFSGDAIPVHLLTIEAFNTYWKHLNPEHGLIAIHISSNHVDLMPVIEGTAEHYKAYTLLRDVDGELPYMPSAWVILARHREDLQVNGLVPTPQLSSNLSPRVWTDDYSDIIRLLR